MVRKLTQCRFVWWRDLSQDWVRCVHFADGHATGLRPKHEHGSAFVKIGSEEFVDHYWVEED